MQMTDYVKPELIVVVLVLYSVDIRIKQSETVKDRYIPLINDGLGIVTYGIYVLATSTCRSGQRIFIAIFTAITQGILLAGLSTYVNQIIKQAGREEQEGESMEYHYSESVLRYVDLQ